MDIGFISIGFLLGSFWCLDFFLLRKKKGDGIKSIVYLFTVSLPAIVDVSFTGLENEVLLNGLNFYFYPTFALSIILVFLLTYFFAFKPLVNGIINIEEYKRLTFLDFIFNGYTQFKIETDRYYDEASRRTKMSEASYIKLIRQNEESLRTFIHRLLITFNEDLEPDAYLAYFFKDFVNRFFGHSHARFTIRIYDPNRNEMDTLFTTSEHVPGPINLNKKNLIEKARCERRPIIKSRYRNHHQNTSRGSYGSKSYDDYVSYCLLEADNKPLVSLSLDVKGQEAINRLHAFVDSSIYQIICQFLATKIITQDEQA